MYHITILLVAELNTCKNMKYDLKAFYFSLIKLTLYHGDRYGKRVAINIVFIDSYGILTYSTDTSNQVLMLEL